MGTGQSNAIRGLITRGATDFSVDYITIDTTGNATDFGDTTSYGREISSMCTSDTRAVRGGGSSPDTNVMDYAEIMTTGNFTDFGDLNTTGNSKAATSNGHGGL